LASDAHSHAEAERIIRRLGEHVAERLRRTEQSARTVQLKVRYGDFTTMTRARTLAHPTDVTSVIVETACQLLDELAIRDGFRLLGVSVALLAPTAVQSELPFGGASDPGQDAVIDAVRARFGTEALMRASEIGD
jgi:DNA polymerase-4